MSAPSEPKPVTQVPTGTIVHAIGDIHGRVDLLNGAIDAIEAEMTAPSSDGKRFITIFLGDYIDRGPDSKAVLSRLAGLSDRPNAEWVFLRGNHEQVLLDLVHGMEVSTRWTEFGGVATLESYGVDPSTLPANNVERLGQAVREAVPAGHIEFLKRTKLNCRIGDYRFVHAGLRPDRMFEEQSTDDMLWFRYYADGLPIHGEFVVHGHSPNEKPILGRSRIGIDTEAYASGALTALRLEGEDRQFLRISRSGDASPEVSTWQELDGAYGRRTRTASAAPAPELDPLATRPKRRFFGIMASILVLAVVLSGTLLLVLNGGRAAEPRHRSSAERSAEIIRMTSLSGPDSSLSQRDRSAERVPTVAVATTQAVPEQRSVGLPSPAPGWRVQIGALDTPELAENAWRRIAGTAQEALPAAAPQVEKVRVSGKTYYRSYVTGFPDSRSATSFCSTLQASGHPCIVHSALRQADIADR